VPESRSRCCLSDPVSICLVLRLIGRDLRKCSESLSNFGRSLAGSLESLVVCAIAVTICKGVEEFEGAVGRC